MEQQTIVVEYKDKPPTGDKFTPMPDQILWHKKLSSGAKLVYASILNCAVRGNSMFPGQERFADEIGVHLSTLNRYLQELRNQELLETKRQGLGKTDIYILKQLS